MATKKISELEAITEADGSDVLAIVDVSEGKTNKITKNNLLKGSGHTIEMSLNENYQIVLKLKNAEGTELSTATIDLPNENAITNISYSNGTLTLTKQSGVTSTVDISGLINGLATETALTNLANALKETIGIDTTTYNESQTYNTGDIVVQNEKIYKANQDNITGTFDSSKWDEISLYEYQKIQDEAIEENYKVITKLQEDVEDLTERVEDAENNEITNTPEVATSHYLQDSADSRFRKFIPIGRTTQESTTGANLINTNRGTFTSSGLTFNYLGNGQYDINGTTTQGLDGYIALSINVALEQNTTYTMFYEVIDGTASNLGDMNFAVNGTKNGTTTANMHYMSINNITSKGIKKATFSTSTNDEVLKQVNIYIGGSGRVFNHLKIRCMIYKGTEDISWEKYTGGEPAPSPNYPIAIKNTGDNGSVNEKVQNKNVCPFTNQDFTLNGVRFYVQNGTLYFNGTSTSETLTNNVAFKNNFAFILKAGSYKLSRQNAGGTQITTALKKYFNDETIISLVNAQNNSVTFTLTEDTKVYMGFYIYNKTFTNETFSVQIEQGSTATSYVPHEEQNISFPLAQGQKLMEGDYPADDEKVHHVRGEVVLDGTETVTKGTSTLSQYNYFLVDKVLSLVPKYMSDFSNSILCTHFKGMRTEANLYVDNGICISSNLNRFVITDNSITTASDFKAYLAEQYANGTPVKVVYELAEEQTEDFTSEQQTAWEQIKKARTYKNITHISSEDETPANVEIEYVVDINTIDDRITALEARVDLLEE